MRIAISGSTGFIGSALTHDLRFQGHRVHPIVRRLPRDGEIGIDLIHRVLDLSGMEGESLEGIDVFYHLAGEPLTATRWSAAKREAIRASRITTTDIISRAIASMHNLPYAFVTMSAVGYYGDRGAEQLTETSSSGRGFLADLCCAWEAATAPARAIGVRVVHARSGIVLSSAGGIVKQLTPLFRLGLGAQLGDGRQWMSHIALADEVNALQFVAKHESIVGPCNFTSPLPTTNATFTKALARLLSRPAPLRVPASVLRVVLGKHVANDLALASQRAIPERLQEAGFTFAHPHVADALLAD